MDEFLARVPKTSEYDAFSVQMGQLTVYRLTLKCKCLEERLATGQRCGRMVPFELQPWPALMGAAGDADFDRRGIFRQIK